MKNKISLLLAFFIMLALTTFAQKEKMTREEKDEKNQARLARISNKNDYVIFRRQMLALKELADERKKIPAIQKTTKAPVKIVPVIDSLDEEADANNKSLLGFIRQDIGDNSTNLYEVKFDRTQKKIVAITHTPEGIEADKELMADKEEKTTTVKTTTKTVVRKKTTEDDEDMDEEKPVKAKGKQKDPEDEDD